MVVKAFRVVDGELVEVDFSYRDVANSLSELSESLKGFGESSLTIVSGFDDSNKAMQDYEDFNIKLNTSYENTSIVIKNLCRELRKKPKLENWKGEGKRRMKVIK